MNVENLVRELFETVAAYYVAFGTNGAQFAAKNHVQDFLRRTVSGQEQYAAQLLSEEIAHWKKCLEKNLVPQI